MSNAGYENHDAPTPGSSTPPGAEPDRPGEGSGPPKAETDSRVKPRPDGSGQPAATTDTTRSGAGQGDVATPGDGAGPAGGQGDEADPGVG
ncbi:hypothetical protein [uncultured Enterovirga sp.]|uniref:hypothetical protein n=1 Tax=uncultured Enterovirga sp. TaxID=2026352 RepID=UPI0035CA0A0C